MLSVNSVLVLFCLSVIASAEKKVCSFDDDKCLTEGAERLFLNFVSGIDGVESSDPLHLDLIEADLPTLKYKLTNSTLSGMLTCKVELTRIFIKESKYNYNVGCSHLILETDIEAKGQIGSEYIESSGTCKVDFDDYHFLFDGDFERFIDDEGKLHLIVKNHILKYEARGNVHYNCTNLSMDKDTSDALHKYANENWKIVHEQTRQPVMEAFMNKFFVNINDFLTVVPVQDLFYEEV